eukprot:246186-Prymnesium_polylepis.1
MLLGSSLRLAARHGRSILRLSSHGRLIQRQPSRPLFHLPALGAIAGAASLAAKKVALHAVVKKLGVRRVFGELAQINEDLHRARPDLHGRAAHDSIEGALATLDSSFATVREDERVQQAWKYFESLEKENPRLYEVLVKSYLDTLAPVKWASALLKDSSGSSSSSAPPPSNATEADVAKASADGTALLRKLHAAAPELADYHVILVPKVDLGAKAAQSRGPGEKESG